MLQNDFKQCRNYIYGKKAEKNEFPCLKNFPYIL